MRNQINELNPAWKGDNVGYKSLHEWIRRHLPIPELCETCNLIPPKHLANITGIYNRDFSNWKYFCIPCHRVFDQTIDMTDRKCSKCGDSKSYRRKWYHSKLSGKRLCHNCNIIEYRQLHRQEYLEYNRSRNLRRNIFETMSFRTK